MKGLVVTLLFAGLFNAINGNAQSCILTSPSNMIVKAEQGKEGAAVHFPAPESFGEGECGTISYAPASGSFFRIGSHSVIMTTESGQKTFFTLTVTDNEPPVLSPLTLSSRKLSPAKNKMKKIAVYYTARDNTQEIKTSLSVTSNDSNGMSGSRDSEVVNDHLVRLQTAPLPNGDSRVYTITVTCTDGSGNLTRRSTTITVPGSTGTAYKNLTIAH